MMKSINILLRNLALVVLLMTTSVFFSGCSSAEFELSSLKINPDKIVPGETVNITATLANIGNAEGTHAVTLSLDGIQLETTNMTLTAESNLNVNFQLSRDTIGEYTITVNDLAGQLLVVEPARCEFNSLQIIPEEVILGEEITIAIDATNTGGFGGTFSCNFTVNSRLQENKEFTLDSGETTNLAFTYLAKYKPGKNTIEINGLEREFTVLKPAQLEIKDVSISETTIITGANITVNMSVRNYGDVSGTTIFDIYLNGDSVENFTVTLDGGDQETITPTIFTNNIGKHLVTIEEKNRYLTIIPKTPEGYAGYLSQNEITLIGDALQEDYFIILPETWIDAEKDRILAFIGHINDNGTYPSCSLVGEDIPMGLSLQEYCNISQKQYQLFNEYKSISVEDISINGVSAKKQVISIELLNNDMTMTQAIMVNDGIAYIITLGAPTSDYPDFVEIFDTIINSFHFLSEQYE